MIFDAVGKTTFAQCQQPLKDKGYYLHTGMVASEIKGLWYSMTTGEVRSRLRQIHMAQPQGVQKGADCRPQGSCTAITQQPYRCEIFKNSVRYLQLIPILSSTEPSPSFGRGGSRSSVIQPL